MALQLDVKIFDLVQILDAALADCGIVEEIYDRDQYAIKVQAVVSREKQIAVWGVRPKSRLRHPNRGELFGPFLPALPLIASRPDPLNRFCFA